MHLTDPSVRRRRRVTARVVFASLAATSLFIAGCGAKSSGDSGAGSRTLVLGASLSLTGSLAREGALTKEGYEVCQDTVNKKGGVDVGGSKLQLDIRYQDDASKPDTSAQLIDQFNDDGVKLILGPYGSAATAAAAAVVERNGQVMADSSGADDTIFTKGYRRTFAVLSPGDEYASDMVQAIYDMASPRPTTIAFLSADDGFSKTVTAAGVAKAKALGFTVVDTEYVANGTTDVSGALTKIKAHHPDVIVGSAHLAEGVALVKQSRELDVKPSAFAETVAPPTPDFVSTLGASAEGVLGSTQWSSTTKGSDQWFGSASDYAATFAAKFGGRQPEYHGAEATAACLALMLAVQNTHSTDADKVRDALAALDTPTFFGQMKFDSTGVNIYKGMAVIQIQGGKPVTVWPAPMATAAMKWPGTAS